MGLIASIVAVLFLNFVFLVLSVMVVTESYAGISDYLKACLARTVETYQVALEFCRTHLLPALQGLVETLARLFCPNYPPPAAP